MKELRKAKEFVQWHQTGDGVRWTTSLWLAYFTCHLYKEEDYWVNPFHAIQQVEEALEVTRDSLKYVLCGRVDGGFSLNQS